METSVNNNQFSYNELSLFTPTNEGINYFNDLWSASSSKQIIATFSTGSYYNNVYPCADDDLQGVTKYAYSQADIILFRLHGTITRNSLTDGTRFYYIIDKHPLSDEAIMVAPDGYNLDTYIDLTFMRPNIDTHRYGFYLCLFNCKDNYVINKVPVTVNLTIDKYFI